MFKNFPLDKINCTKKCPLFSFASSNSSQLYFQFVILIWAEAQDSSLWNIMHAIFSAHFLTLRAGQSLVSWFLVSPNTILRKDNLIFQWISLSNTNYFQWFSLLVVFTSLITLMMGGRVFWGVGDANLRSDFCKNNILWILNIN